MVGGCRRVGRSARGGIGRGLMRMRGLRGVVRFGVVRWRGMRG